MESFMRRSRQWGRVVSVLFALLVLVRATQQSEMESELLPHSVAFRAPINIYTGGPKFEVPLYTGGPFEVGDLLTIPSITKGPPRPLLIAAPNISGVWPVVQFQHGWGMYNSYYSQLLTYVASFGFIVVAPQMYKQWNLPAYLKTDATEEICAAASVTDWLQRGLNQTLPPSVEPQLDKLAVMGHSRGGKVAFGLATQVCNTSLKFSAIVGLDPIDALFTGQTKPPILHFSPHDLKLGMPTLIVGGGLSCEQKHFDLLDPCPHAPFVPSPPCGPIPFSHDQFFNESDALAFHFVAPKNGHMDYLDDDCGVVGNIATYCPCVNGPAREPMRNFTGGITAIFLFGSLVDPDYAFDIMVNSIVDAPVPVKEPEIYGDFNRAQSA